ncbi:endopeptidase La [Parafrankia colletiae]|uniref:Lon protease n=1 Tax=Parafrankia colletiae TaxID=573497 RepID=A0A1S1QMC1_9ACTN|nr:endopeptidase La [Parafrankia colletiae]MCK9902737.1 endopeptidase La [Frankia sp. Cpl3]OHV35873.1 endopeptidase La [Parafrankia colletiae]
MSQTRLLPLLPLDDTVLLPGMVVPLDLSDDRTRAAVDAARGGRPDSIPEARAPGISSRSYQRKAEILLVPRVEGELADIGVVAVVEQIGRLPNGTSAAVVRAAARARLQAPPPADPGPGDTGPADTGRADIVPGPADTAASGDDVVWVEATVVEAIVPPGFSGTLSAPHRDGDTATDPDNPDGAVARLVALALEYRSLVTGLLRTRGVDQVADTVAALENPSTLADTAGYSSYLSTGQKLELLRTLDVTARLEKLIPWTKEHAAEVEVAETIRRDVQEGVDRQQREFLLRRQLDAVRKELAELDGSAEDAGKEDYRARIEAADLPEKVRVAALKEVDKLERTTDSSPEGGWIRTWLDTVLELPWNSHAEDTYDITAARAVLDADHAGLDDVKDRIVEYLAVRRRRADAGLGVVGGRRSGAVLALAGPPGVGKTSLGESVARAMGRKFARVALGGVRDEAEIRGHRRTYVGAQPGRIVRAIREAGSMNPVILLDEVDKVGSDYRGDPTAALLEVLDPAQNHTFRDHYLEVELDLSDVLFLATANVLEAIPAPLLDRMELILLDGYTEEEKVTIARDHLLPRQVERAGLTADDVVVEDEALRQLAGEYTREAGVRDLERATARVLRKVVAKVALGETALPVTIGAGDLTGYLGRPRHTPESAERTALPGVATGLAVTGAGGDVLFVEASLADPETGASGVTLTGQLGDVMKESAQIALSYLRSRGVELELPVGDLRDRGIHIHVPAGAVPKDGPSAGVTMTTALASLLSGRPVRADVAMTGEVSLTGRVLPIGGVKQKLLAAHRAGLTTVLLPTRNGPDLDDVPAAVREALTVHLVADVREVLELALEPAFDTRLPKAVAA